MLNLKISFFYCFYNIKFTFSICFIFKNQFLNINYKLFYICCFLFFSPSLVSFSVKMIFSLQIKWTKTFYWKKRNKRNFFKKSQMHLILQMQKNNWDLDKDLLLSKYLHTVLLLLTFWKLDLKTFLNTFASKKNSQTSHSI